MSQALSLRSHWFRVKAYNSTDSAPSNVANTTTSANLPNAPVGLTAVANSSTQINLAWTNLLADQDGFRIEESADGTHFTQIGTAGSGTTSYSVASLTPGATYYFRVRAYSAVGNSDYSNDGYQIEESVEGVNYT